MCVLKSKIILTDSNLFFYFYAFLGNPQLLIITLKLQENFILINNLFVIDCLDNEKTEYEYFEKDIIGVEKYSFKQLDYPPLFQITLPNGYVELFYFVTDEFIKIINDNDIKGFLFEEVWDSEKD